MMTTAHPPDRALVAALLRALDPEKSLREAADDVGVAHTMIRRFREGTWVRLMPSTRRTIVAYLRSRGIVVPPDASPDAGMTPAERLIAALDHPVVQVESLASAEDRVRAAWAYAGVHPDLFPEVEMEKLRRWRADLLAPRGEDKPAVRAAGETGR